MTQVPSVSVVMSVYNGAETLKATMDSVLSQEGVDLEFIIIDDGSTDGSDVILDDYALSDVRVRITHQDNAGLTRALIFGCAQARGKYIARQDVGDLSLPDRLERQAQILEKNPDCALVSCWTEFLGPEDQLLYVTKGTRKSEQPIDILSIDAKWGVVDGPSHHGSVMFRKDIYIKTGGYREAFYYGQDWDLWYRLSSLGKFIMIQHVLYQAKILINSISGLNKEVQEHYALLSHRAMLLRAHGMTDENIIQEVNQVERIEVNKISAKQNGDAYYFLGECLRKNNHNNALIYFMKAIKKYPFHAKSWFRLVQIYFQGLVGLLAKGQEGSR